MDSKFIDLSGLRYFFETLKGNIKTFNGESLMTSGDIEIKHISDLEITNIISQELKLNQSN